MSHESKTTKVDMSREGLCKEIDRMNLALKIIRDYPITDYQNMDAQNMRKIVEEATWPKQ